MKHLTLREYVRSEPVELSVVERDALEGLVPSLTISAVAGEENLYTLTPSSYVGAVTVAGLLDVEIQPKIEVRNVLFLLSYAMDPKHWKTVGFDFDADVSLVEAMIPGFLAQVGAAFSRGLLEGYRTEEDSLSTVRGRIRFDDQIRYRFGLAPPIEVRFDEYTEDIEENRLIKAAINRLRKLKLRSEFARRALRRHDAVLAPVSLMEYDPRQVPEVTYTRLNERYRSAIQLARLILRSRTIRLARGGVSATSFLVDMNAVFESFVVVALREALGATEKDFPQGAKGRKLRLDERGAIQLKPDLSWWDAGRCVFVGDVKYKRTSIDAYGSSEARNPDLYQLLAYTVATDLPSGLLVYAAGEGDDAVHDVVYLGRKLSIITLDLSVEHEVLISAMEGLADRVRALRAFVLT